MLGQIFILALLLGVSSISAQQDDTNAVINQTSSVGDQGAIGRVTFERTDREIRVLLNGALFTSLRFGDAQKPYLYPVIGPGGVFVTRGHPIEERRDEAKDHPHHTSLWFAHGDVNGHDFWHGGHGEWIVHVETRLPQDVPSPDDSTTIAPSPAPPGLQSTFEWRDPDGYVLCTEHRTMWFAGSKTMRTIDMDITLTASRENVTFGDTKEGTFALRLAPTLRLEGDVAQGRARNSTGTTGADVWGERAKWIEYAGPLDGTYVGVAIFDHPKNPRHPTWWHARTYGLIAANAFGRQAFEGPSAVSGDVVVKAGQSIRFRYRLIIHEGAWDAERLDSLFKKWAATP